MQIDPQAGSTSPERTPSRTAPPSLYPLAAGELPKAKNPRAFPPSAVHLLASQGCCALLACPLAEGVGSNPTCFLQVSSSGNASGL